MKWTTTANGFEAWMKKVNAIVAGFLGAGLDTNDLPDKNYADWYEDGMKPITAAKKAIKDEDY